MSKVLSFAVIFLLGMFLGWGSANMYGSGSMLRTGQGVGIGGGPGDNLLSPRPEATATQLAMNNVFHEHVNLTTLHLQGIYDGKNTSATDQLLETNAQQISSFIGSVYGDNARFDFLTMWREHINLYENYAKSLRVNDYAGMSTAKERLVTINEELGQKINQISPNMSDDIVTRLMMEHTDLTLRILDAYAARQQTRMVNQIKSAEDQATRFSSYIFKGMIEAKPEAFR